jgi:hypothetical protein
VISQLHSEGRSILCNGIFRILRTSWKEILLVQQVVNACGNVGVLTEGAGNQGRVQDGETSQSISSQRRNLAGVLPVECSGKPLVEERHGQVQFDQICG